MEIGSLVIVLHSHMPWVLGHGNWPHGEDWLCEAVAETYIPLLNRLNELVNDNKSPKITIGISPILCEMLSNIEFQSRFIDYCLNKVSLAKLDEEETIKRYNLIDDISEKESLKDIINLCGFWQNFFNQSIIDFKLKYNCNLLEQFKTLQDYNHIEIITCGATHGYFPLLGTESSIKFQIKIAVNNYKKHFDKSPRGIWLPECAYRNSYEWKSFIAVAPFDTPRQRSGIEVFLKENNLDFFVTDEKLLTQSELLGWFADDEKKYFLNKEFQHQDYYFHPNPMKLYNISSDINNTETSSVIFTRDVTLALKVWSGEGGYPGDGNYLDFHKKNMNSKLRYWSVTSTKLDMAYKKTYKHLETQKVIDLQSNNYISLIESAGKSFNSIENTNATICLPFDTELFGHWWFEGVDFLYYLLKGISNSPYIKNRTCSEQLDELKPKEVIKLKEGSWGENNNHDVWSNEKTYWVWEHIYNSELKLQKLFKILDKNTLEYLIKNKNNFLEIEVLDRLLKQLLRESLLLQASDWSFLITNESAKDYAENRFSFHLADFNRLYDIIANNFGLIELINNNINTNKSFELVEFKISEDETRFLYETERRNCPFPELNYLDFEIDTTLN